MNEVQNPGSVNEPQTPEVTPQTRDTLLEQLNFLIDGARSNLMDMKASLAIDGPLLKPEPQYTKEQVVKMLRSAYDLGATAHEESMEVQTDSWQGGVAVDVELEDGGFSYNGSVTIEEDTIRDVVNFDTPKMTDEHGSKKSSSHEEHITVPQLCGIDGPSHGLWYRCHLL